MSKCRCETPRENDRRPGYCRRCGKGLNPCWISSDDTLAAFQSEVAKLPGVTPGILIDSHRRERAGRVEFGLKYLGRDNDAEAQEEYADGLIYAHLSRLNDIRNGVNELDPDLLDAAHHAALAYAAIERRRRRLGR
jgi:hypothetical protein